MHDLPSLSLHGLRDHQHQALTRWRQTQDNSIPFEAWATIYRSWNTAPQDQKDVWLGHVAVLWQEINTLCAGASWLPLLNQFVQIGFRGITPKMPRDFSPALAPEAAAWLGEFIQCLPLLNQPGAAASAERLFDAMLFQYAVVFGRRAQKQNRAFVAAQLEQVAFAKQCQRSELLLATSAGEGEASSALPLVDLLTEAVLPTGTAALASLLPEDRAHSHADQLTLAQLLLFWAERAPWFGAAVGRLAPHWLPAPAEERLSKPQALQTGSGCDQHVLLLAANDPRRWLLASEAASHIVAVTSLGNDVTALREAWRSGGALPPPLPVPELQVVVEPKALCRAVCWQLPEAYVQSHAVGVGGGAVRAVPDAQLVRLCDDIIAAQKPGGVIAVFDWTHLSSTVGAAAVAAYEQLARKLASVLHPTRTSLDGVRWSFVFDNAPDPEASVSADPDPALLAEYSRSMRGVNVQAESVTFANRGGRDLSALLNIPECRRSFAFFERLRADLTSVGSLLDTLRSLGFTEVSVFYTRSTPGESAAWQSFSHVWDNVRSVLAANSFAVRQRYLSQEWLQQLSEHTAPRGSERSVGHRVPWLLSELLNDGSGHTRHSESSLNALWSDLAQRVQQGPLLPEHYESLWASSEAGRRSQFESASVRAEKLAQLMVALLEELGIPNYRLSEFGWTTELSTAPMSVLSADDWTRLENLARKPQPVLTDDEDFRALKAMHTEYDVVYGSLSHHCLLKDYGPEASSARLMYEHGQSQLVQVLFDPTVPTEIKTRLIFSLRGYQPPAWRCGISMARGERDLLKFQTISQLSRDILLADIILVHLVRLCVMAGVALRTSQTGGTSKWQFRRAQLLRLLDTGGLKAELAAEDADSVRTALRRVIDLWKDFYRNRGPHRTKQRTARIDALKQEYEQLSKPMAQPALHADLSTEKAEELERHAYVATCTAELVARIPMSVQPKSGQSQDSAEFDVDDFARRAKTLTEQYVMHKGRYMLRRAALVLEGAQWLRGYGPDKELVGRDALAAPQVDPALHAQRIATAVGMALREEEERVSRRSLPPPPEPEYLIQL